MPVLCGVEICCAVNGIITVIACCCCLQAIRALIEKSKVLQKEIVAQGRVCVVNIGSLS